jgi:polar amino acid transport system ATP-binding protein
MLVLKNISKKFGSKTILDNISVTVAHGEIAVFLGSSGVGKSTLLRILNNLESIDSGSVELDGTKIDLATVNKNHVIGMVFQQFNLFDHLTVLENITLALEHVATMSKQDAHKRALDLLARYELASKANNYPTELSGGQKQRLALARTLALQPQVVCMDEPTSALDPLLTRYVAHTIAQLAQQGYIVVIATHDTDLLRTLDCTIYLMDNGAVVQHCTSKELNEHPERYKKIAHFIAGTQHAV